jgi:H+/Cl- antiporter ClcA
MSESARPESAVSESPVEFRVPVRRLLMLTVPALVVGIGCALTLWGLSELGSALEHLLWTDLPGVFGLTSDSRLWIALMLVLTAVLVGLVVRFAPGHAGPDPATTGLVETPLRLSVLPGLAVALVLMLAGGVSLGPENPIMAINAALVVWLGSRIAKGTKAELWMSLSVAGTIGALFGTPAAAALMFSELDPGDRRIPLWDRLYAPLLAATAGAIVMTQVSSLDFRLNLPPYTDMRLRDLLTGAAIAVGMAVVGLLAAYVFTPVHALLRRTGQPFFAILIGGLVLAGLGALGGPVTLFKGLEQMKDLHVGENSAGWFFGIAGIKLVALLVASASGFRGGRIFPATFVGVAVGYGVNALWPSIPVGLAVSCAVVGIVVAATRSGWLSAFLAADLVPDTLLLIPIFIATLAAWLVVTNRRELRATDLDPVREPGPQPAAVRGAGDPPPGAPPVPPAS